MKQTKDDVLLALIIILVALIGLKHLLDSKDQESISRSDGTYYSAKTVTVTTTMSDNKNDNNSKSSKDSKKKKTSSVKDDGSSYFETESFEPESTFTEYVDERIPNFVRTREPEYKDTSIEYYAGDWSSKSTITVHIDKEKYEYYRSLPRYYRLEDYHYYIDDENNKKEVKALVDCILKYNTEEGKSRNQAAEDLIHFVQAIPYMYDIDSTGEKNFPKYPIETLYDGCGDCEDTSLLLAAALREMDFGVCLLAYDSHIAVAIQGGEGFSAPYFEYEGKKYYYIETTSEGRNVGEIPDDYKTQSAQMIFFD